MKFSAFATAAIVAMAPTTSAWRIYLYNWEEGNTEGGYYTESGPGGTGERCHTIGDINNKVSSIRYYATDRQTNPTTKCDVTFYNSLGCKDRLLGPISYNFFANTDQLGINNEITTYKTRCWAI